jgi:hypothetical protein
MTDKFELSIEPIVVRPRIARAMLGGIGTEHLWQLINSGDLESYLDGRARRITVASIRAHIARQLGATKQEVRDAAASANVGKAAKPAPAAPSNAGRRSRLAPQTSRSQPAPTRRLPRAADPERARAAKRTKVARSVVKSERIDPNER